MTILRKSALLAGMTALALATPAFAKDKDKNAAPAAAAPAAASTGNSAPMAGMAIADLAYVVQSANATVEAEKQRLGYYKATIDSYQTRAQQLQAQIDTMVAKHDKDAALPNANKVAIKAQEDAIERLQQSGEAEVNRIIAPVIYSREYVKEQVALKLDEAVKTAMAKRGVTLLLNPQVVVVNTSPQNDLTPEILQQINTIIPTAQFIPPPGWEPAEVRRLRAQQNAAAAAQGRPVAATPPAAAPGAAAPTAPAPRPTTPAGPQPDGR